MATAVNLEVQAIANLRVQWETGRQKRRVITPDAGRALELLGHAIEYLTDEYVGETKNLSSTDPQVAAILLLMDLNRKVYFGCPIRLTVGERIRAFLYGTELP